MSEEATNTTVAPDGGATSSTAEGGDNYWQTEARKAFEQRDQVKQKLRELEVSRKEAAAAEERRLAEAGEFKAMYEKASKRLAELEPVAEQFATMREHLAAQVAAASEALPEDLRELVPGNLSEIEQLGYINKLKSKLGAAQQPGPRVPPASPPSANGLPDMSSMSAAERVAYFRENKDARKEALKGAGKDWLRKA